MSGTDLLKLFAAQPVLDVAYTAGVIHGSWLAVRGVAGESDHVSEETES
jgi:hypothetical protein